MNRRQQYDNPINEHTAKVLTQIREIVGVLDVKMDDQKHEFRVLEQAVEMNLWVQLKVMQEGIDPESSTEDLVRGVRQLQREYLAIVALVNFFRHMASIEVSPDPLQAKT